MNTLAEDIAAARDWIATHGWCQGSFNAPDGTACIRGAFITATDIQMPVETQGRLARFHEFLQEYIVEQGTVESAWRLGGWWFAGDPSKGCELIAYYNDNVLKDQQEALEFLDKARIKAEEQGL